MKKTKIEAGYRSRAKFRKCINCLYYNNKKCSIVAGTISPSGTSNYWHKNKEGKYNV